MRKIILKISSLLIATLLIFAAFTGCDLNLNGGSHSSGGGTQEGGTQEGGGAQEGGGSHEGGGAQEGGNQKPDSGEAVAVPKVKIDKDGFATWDPVEDALYYLYTIDGGEETANSGDGVQLTDGQSIRVKTVSCNDEKSDSDFSEAVTYHAGDVAELTFYAINDLHGKFMDTDAQPGVDEFTTYMKDLYADPDREEILLSSGDMWQGTVESSSNHGQLMTEWMNDVGFVSMTLGNHEYDWGPTALTTNSQLAEFPLLGINVTYNGVMPDYCRASTIVEKDGVKIGIIGAIGDCLSSISGEFQSGLRFATGSSLTSLVKKESTRLRTEENCDLIVYSLHDGGSKFSSTGINSAKNSDMAWYDTSLSNGYVDLVFEGHTHYQYIAQDEYGVFHLQGGGENRAMSCAKVDFNRVTKEFTVTPSHISKTTYGNASIKDDPIVEELYEKHFPEDGPFGDPYADILGRNSYRRDEGAICEQVASLYMEVGKARWSNYDIVLAGGYLNTRSPGSLSAGDVTYADLYSLLPFDNEIVLGSIRGSDLNSQFFNSKVGYTYVSEIDQGSVNSSQIYYIIVDTYTAYYGRNNITVIERYDSGVYARDLVADFIKGGGWE